MIDIETADPEQFLDALRYDRDSVFAEIVRLHHAGLVAVAASLVGRSEAEEVAQEAWISAYQSIDGFEGRSSLKTWLTRIVINHARMRLRRAGREINLEPPGNNGDPFSGAFKPDGHWLRPPPQWQASRPDEMLDEQSLLDCLLKHLELLPDNQRTALEMRDIQGLALEEICNILEVTSSNIRVLLHRARGRIYKMVDHFQETGEC
jgi:RNA polymerase sigma-70 factor (ECF subfamily)